MPKHSTKELADAMRTIRWFIEQERTMRMRVLKEPRRGKAIAEANKALAELKKINDSLGLEPGAVHEDTQLNLF